MGGVRYLSTDYTQTAQGGYNSPNDKKPNMTTSLLFKTTGGADDQTREITWYALADYSLNERYYLNAGVSAQASSRFGNDANGGLKLFNTVWGFFPSVEGAWVMTNEKWLAGIKGIDYLRLNVGFDITGNDDIESALGWVFSILGGAVVYTTNIGMFTNILKTDSIPESCYRRLQHITTRNAMFSLNLLSR